MSFTLSLSTGEVQEHTFSGIFHSHPPAIDPLTEYLLCAVFSITTQAVCDAIVLDGYEQNLRPTMPLAITAFYDTELQSNPDSRTHRLAVQVHDSPAERFLIAKARVLSVTALEGSSIVYLASLERKNCLQDDEGLPFIIYAQASTLGSIGLEGADSCLI